MKKRLLSFLLVFCMVFSLVPVTAFAAEDKQETSVEQENPFKDVKETDWFYDSVCEGSKTTKKTKKHRVI